MPWVWFIIVSTLCLAGSYWILSGQRAEPVEALVAWLSINPVSPVFTIPVNSLGLPIAIQAGISFVMAGLVGLCHAYLPQYRSLAALLIIVLWMRLLAWRITQALVAPNHSVASVLSLAWLIFEVLAFVLLVLWWLRHQNVKIPAPLPALHKPTAQPVRILLYVDRQPMHLVNQSLQSALGVQWSEVHVTVIDLHKRLDVAALCRKRPVDYWAQAEGLGWSDTLNLVVGLTTEPYILWLKAGDLLPPDVLMAGVPYLQMDTATFVQFGVRASHPDVLQRNLKLDAWTNDVATEQLWLSYVADANAGFAPCLGSGLLMKRHPVEKTWLKTGIRLQKGQKQKAFYAPHITVLSYSPDSFGDWLANRLQQQMWRYQALMEALKPFNGPHFRLFMTGVHSLSPWLQWGAWIIPLVSLYTGCPIIPASLGEVAMYYVPFLLGLHFGYPVLTRQLNQYLFANLYVAADCLLPTWPIPNDYTDRFRDTSQMRWRWAKVPLILAVLTIFGLMVGIARQWHAPDGALSVFIISALWALYNLVLLGGVSLIARERRETRLMPRLNTPLRGLLSLPDDTVAIGWVVNLSESGLELQFDTPVPTIGARSLTLLDWPNPTELSVEPVHSVIERSGAHYVAFKVLRRPDSQRQQIIRHLCRAMPPAVKPVALGTVWGLIPTLPFWIQGRPEIANRRRIPRFAMTLSAVLEHNQQYYVCFSQTLSEQGISLVLKEGHTLTPGDTCSLRLQWPDNSLSTFQVKVLNRLPQLDNDVLNLVFVDITPALAQTLIRQLYQPSPHLVRVAPALHRQINLLATLPNGQTVRGVTISVCEKGIIAMVAQVEGLLEGQALPISVQWDDARPMDTYTMQIVALNQPLKQVMLYFTEQTVPSVLKVSEAMTPATTNSHVVPGFLQ